MGTPKDTAHGIPQYSGGLGFENWSFRVKMYLDAAAVLHTLTENCPAEEAAKKTFKDADRKAKSLIVGFLADEVLEVVRDKTSAKDMWSSLTTVFAKKSVASQTLLRKQLGRLRMKDGSSMRAHLLAFDDLVRQLKTAGAELANGDLVSQLFLSLPDSYDPLVTALENIKEEDLTLDVVKQRLLAEEQKRADRSGEPSDEKPAAFVGQQGKRDGNKFKGKCHKCGKFGHMKRDCKQKEAHAAAGRNAVSFMVNRDGVTKSGGGMVHFKLDSGSTDHLVSVRTFFDSVERLPTPVVINVAKDGHNLVAKEEGVINGYSNQGVFLNVRKVLYVPDLRDNLLSVKKLAAAGVEVLFLQDKAVLKKGDEVIATATLKGNLYELNIKVSEPSANVCQVDRNELWHRRLGHLGQGGMAKIVQKDMAIGVDFKPGQLRFCDPCAQGKQCRDPFDGTRERAKRPLERVHSDVCDPIDSPVWEGSRCCLWSKKDRKVVSARDVRFDETCFPFESEPRKKEKPLVVLPSYEQEGEQEADAEPKLDPEEEEEEEDSDSSEESFEDSEGDPEEEESTKPTASALPLQTGRREAQGQSSRHSERERRLPGKLLDYFTGFQATSAAFSSTIDVPETYQDVLGRDDRDEWLEAIQDELDAMESNQVWKLAPCPADVKPLKTKWVFRVKEDEQGRPVRYKARLVAKGFLQKPGLDYEETYAPVAKLATIRIVLAVGVREGFFFHQMDVKTALSSVFAMTDCGELRHFLGIRIDYNRSLGSLKLSQEASIEKVLHRFGMRECNPTRTPMEKGLQLARGGPSAGEPYRELLGSLMYIMLCVRPDVCYPVGYLGRFQQDFATVHWTALKRVVRYLSGTKAVCLDYQRNSDAKALIGYADADWAADLQDRKSVSGFVFKVYGCTVSCAPSSEAEYVVLSAAATEAVWISGILEDLRIAANPVTVYEDNRGCVCMAKKGRGTLYVEPIGTRDQLADLFTKPLEATRFQQLTSDLGLSD